MGIVDMAKRHLQRVPKTVWVCLLSTLMITAVQGSISYAFEYEKILIHNEFYKYLKYLFLLNLLISSILFLSGKSIKISMLAQVCLLLGLFFMVFAVRRYCGEFYFAWQSPWVIIMAIVVLFGAACAVYNVYLRKSFIVYFVTSLLLVACFAYSNFAEFSDMETSKVQNKVYSKHGYLALLYKGYVDKLNNDDKWNLSLKRYEFKKSGKKIHFLHAGKTGGSSVGYFLGEYYKKVSLVEPHTMKSFLFMPKQERDALVLKYDLFHSHLNRQEMVSAEIDIPHKSTIITLRDPKDRLLSLYYFWIFNGRSFGQHHLEDTPYLDKVRDMSLQEFLEYITQHLDGSSHENTTDYIRAFMNNRYPWDNYYVRLLTGLQNNRVGEVSEKDVESALEYLSTIDFVAITEHLDEDLKRLADYYYIPQPKTKIKKNAFHHHTDLYTKITGKKVVKEPITPEIDRELDRLTKYDYIIYNAAKKIRDEQHRKWKAGKMKRALGD